MRFRSLDALRGLAALQVVLAHCNSVSANNLTVDSQWVRFSPIRLITEPHPAVLFFFVLSGFVLTLSVCSSPESSYRDFIVKRFCRIYIPFAASIVLSVTLLLLVTRSAVPGLSSAFASIWTDASPSTVLRHFLMLGVGRADIQLNGVMWSLVHELRISFLMPALVSLFVASLWIGTFSIVGASVAAATTLLLVLDQSEFWRPDTLLNSFLVSVFYLFPFGVGIFLALTREKLISLADRYHWLWWALFIGLLVTLQRAKLPMATPLDIPICLAAGALIAAVIGSGRATRALEWAPLQWLGRVSYSLYLVHLPILLASVYGLSSILPVWASVTVAILLSLVAAEIMNRLIEQPASRLGRILTTSRSEAQAVPQ